MNTEEVRGVLSYLAEQYPQTPAPSDPRRRMEAWLDVMRPYDGRAIMAAARTHVRSGNKWFPTPAELFAIYNMAMDGALPSLSEAWAVCTSPQTQESLAGMHPALKECVGLTGGVGRLAWMDEADMRREIKSAFYRSLRSYEVRTDPELPEAPMRQRLGGGPRMLDGREA